VSSTANPAISTTISAHIYGWSARRLVALPKLIVRLLAQTLPGVAGDRRDEETDHRKGCDQVDSGAPIAELDECGDQQRRKRVEQRRAMGGVDVRVREAVGAGGHLPVLPDTEQQRAEKNQTRSEEDGFRIALELHAGTLIGSLGELSTPVGRKLTNHAAIGAVAPAWE
jgi:hypothetical protein